MISNIRIHNYRGLRNISVSVAPLTVLIGPNNSGKTSFLRAIERAAQVVSNPHVRISPEDHWRGNLQAPVSMQIDVCTINELATHPGQGIYAKNGTSPQFVPVSFFRLPYDVKMTATGFVESQGISEARLGASGENVAAMADYMLRRSRANFDAMEAEARQLIPGLQSLSVSTPTAQSRRLDLVMEEGWEMPADNASSGVRLLLFFLALTHRPEPPRTILIEEPENGIHPVRLEAIMKMLIRLTDRADGPQVILSTHSPYLLDHLTLDRHRVLVFSRNSEGGCTAREVDAERLKPFLEEFMLGEVWINQGENELIDEASGA